MNNGRNVKSLGLNKEEDDPWKDYGKDEQVTQEDIDRAVENWKPSRKPRLVYMALQVLVLFWMLGHFALLYVMMGSPISIGILLYVVVNFIFSGHYFILLNKERKQ